MEQGNYYLKQGTKRKWNSQDIKYDYGKKNLAQNRMQMLQAKLNKERTVESKTIKKYPSDKSINNSKFAAVKYSSSLKHLASGSTSDDKQVPSKRVAYNDQRHHKQDQYYRTNNKDDSRSNVKNFKRHIDQSEISITTNGQSQFKATTQNGQQLHKNDNKSQDTNYNKKTSVNNRLHKIRQQANTTTTTTTNSTNTYSTISRNSTAGISTTTTKQIEQSSFNNNVIKNGGVMLSPNPNKFDLKTISINLPITFSLSRSVFDKLENEDDVEDMDWEESLDCSNMSETSVFSISIPKKQNIICIVPDTNVFIHNLHVIVDVINYKGSKDIQLHIPWMVIKELEQFKDDLRTSDVLKSATMRAEKFINKNLTMDDTKVFGQSSEEFTNQIDIGRSPDDKILACCMQLIEKYDTTILLTSDINLSNKAIINRIDVCSPSDIILTLHTKMQKNIISLKISQKMSKLLSQIIYDLCKDAFKELWIEMDLLTRSPPWSLFHCLKILKKYWRSVFQIKLLKHSLKPIEHLYDILLENKEQICDNTAIFREFLEQIKIILIFLRDLSDYKIDAQKTLNEIRSLASGVTGSGGGG